MTLELLNDLLRLQVPDVYQVVFGPRHDPLATGDGKVGKDAVLFVLVSCVGLKTLAFGVVPQLERIVQRGCQDVLAVGAELDKRDGRVVIVDQSFETLTGGCVPDATEAVVRR